MYRYFLKFMLLTFILITFFNCENNNNIIVETVPSVTNLLTHSYWNLKSDSLYYVEAIVKEPQGNENIEVVSIAIRNSSGDLLYEGVLFDDGAYYHNDNGDKMANDGIYTASYIPADITANPGVYSLLVKAEDKDGNISEPQEISVVFDFSDKPQIINVSVPDTINSIYGIQHIYTTVFDSSGIGNIKDVYFHLEEWNKPGVLKTYFMSNNGTDGDVAEEDSIFTYQIDSTFAIARKGSYKLSFFIENLFGEISEAVEHSVYFVTDKPIITNIEMPDSMLRPTGYDTRIDLIQVWVKDAQGLEDIESVYFYSRKPDGELANNGDSIPLKDDGLNGDYKAGDGVYSFIMIISSSAYIGNYEFYFYARDKTGNLSDSVTKTLEVY